MTVKNTCRLQEHKLRVSSPLFLLLLLLLLLNPHRCHSQMDNGYRDPRFVSQPGDIYSTSTINIAIFDCEAKATSLQTGNEELLDVRFIRNGNFLDNKYHLPKRHDYVVKGELDYVVGLTVKPIELEDNGAEYQCQILIDDEPINMTSSIGRLTVADGRPPAIPISQSSVGLNHVTVTWSNSNILLPSNGPLQGYEARVFTEATNQLIYNRTLDSEMTEYTFTDLEPSTSYKLSILGVNKYGVGNSTGELLTATTKSPVVTGPPTNLSFSTQPGQGNLALSFKAPSLNTQTMTPVIQYRLVYHPSNDQSDTKELFSNTTSFTLDGLSVGTSYSFSVTAINLAGASEPLTVQHTVEPYAGAVTEVPSTFTTTSTPTITPSQSTTVTTITTGTQTLVLTITTSTSAPPSTTTTTTTSSIITRVTTSTTAHSTTAHAPSSRPTSSSDTHTTSMLSSANRASPSSVVTKVTQSPSSSSSSTTGRISNSDGSGAEAVFGNAVVIAIGGMAGFILLAIVVVSILVIVCYVRSRKEAMDFTDFEQPSPWTHKNAPPLKNHWDSSKEGSIKASSSLSGSISHSLSDHELPPIGLDQRYLQLPSDSPPSLRDNGSCKDYGCANEVERETVIQAEVNVGIPPSVTPV